MLCVYNILNIIIIVLILNDWISNLNKTICFYYNIVSFFFYKLKIVKKISFSFNAYRKYIYEFNN